MALADYAAAFRSRKIGLLLLLGFASGLPLALTAGTLQAWLAAENVDIVAIGWFALVGQPYTYKFLWAPFMDRYVPPFLGRRRGWLLVTQVLLAAAIAFMGTLTPAHSVWLLGATALAVAFLSASQAGEKVSAARERIQASLAAAKVKLTEAERALLEKSKEAAKATDEYVRENPWQAVGVAAMAGLVLGILISRR